MSKNNDEKPIIVRRSPIVIVKDFIAVEILAGVLYILAGSVGHYARIYRTLPFADFFSFQLAQAVFLLFTETALVLYIFFRWHREYFEIKNRQLIHRRGFIYRHETIIPLNTLASITHTQGPMGKMAKYGTIQLADQSGKAPIRLRHIPDPKDFVHLLLRMKSDSSRPGASQPVQGQRHEILHLEPSAILSAKEHEGLEFKSTFRWDLRANKVNKELEKSAMKTIAAFLNSRGGQLVIGVDDSKNVLGMDNDYKTLGRPNADGFENHFSHIFHNMIGAEFRQFVRLATHKIQEISAGDKDASREYCVVAVAPAPRPVYLKSDENEEFFIRTGNGTTSLKLSQAASYMESRFKKRK